MAHSGGCSTSALERGSVSLPPPLPQTLAMAFYCGRVLVTLTGQPRLNTTPVTYTHTHTHTYMVG